jgi:cation-transporting ATPase E
MNGGARDRPAAVLDESRSRQHAWSGIVEADKRAVVMGAPEVVLSPVADPGLTRTVEGWTDDGLRVVVLARGPARSLRDANGQPSLPRALSPVAVCGFVEEIRPDARETLRAFEAAGVALKVVSGDNPRTVARIALEAGHEGAQRAAVNGPDLAAVDDAALSELVARSTVVGRAEPALKARIVRALRARGRYVALVGDGVNEFG